MTPSKNTHPSDKDDKENNDSDLQMDQKFSFLDKLSAPNTARTPVKDSLKVSRDFTNKLPTTQDDILLEDDL